jgi:hypothetical protein
MQKIIYFTNSGNKRQCNPDSEKSKELHTCPYREDIYNDYQRLCDCDELQTDNCADDI